MSAIVCSILLALAIAVFTFGTANAYPSYECGCNGCHSGMSDPCAPPPNTAPIADAGTDVKAFVGDTVTLDGSGSVDTDDDNLTYQWSLVKPSGSNASLSNPTAVKPWFVMDVSGNYEAQLVVIDENLASDTDAVRISSQNSAPVADAGPDQTVFVGDMVDLDGIDSTDVDGDDSLRRAYRNFREGNYRQAIRDYVEANRSWIKRWRSR